MALYVLNSGVKFTSHGVGDDPVLRGSVNVEDETWVSEGAGVYSLALAYPVKWLFIDGQSAKMASTDWIDIDSVTTFTVTVDQADLTGLDVIGAYVSSFNRPYSRSRGHLVTGYAAGVITVQRQIAYLDRSWHTTANADDPGVDGRLKLYGLADYITANYDWAFESGTLYIKLPSAPSNFVIRAVKEDAALKIKGSGVEVENLEIKDYHRAGIAGYAGAVDCYIHDNEIHDIREDGIRFTDRNTGVQILLNEIYDCDVRGVYIANADDFSINENEIYNIGMGVNDGWLKDSMDVNHYTLCGITQSTGLITTGSQFVDGAQINDNYIHDIAWAGIHFFKGNGEILRNRVQNPLALLEDAGGIYLAWGLWDYPTAQYAVEVAYNKVWGITEGYWDAGHRMPIYQDNGSGPNEVHHNVVWDVKGQGMYGHLFANSGSAFQNWHDNIVISKKGHCLNHQYIDNGVSAGIQAQGVHMNDNIFVSLVANTECIRYGGNAFVTGGTADGNYYFNPYSAGDVAYNNLTLAAWQSLYSKDTNARSKSNWLTYVNESTAENTHVKLYTNDTNADVNQVIPAGYEDIDGVDRSGQTMIVPAYYGLVVLKTTN